MSATISKIVSKKELEITLLAVRHSLCPKVHTYIKLPDDTYYNHVKLPDETYVITIERYPFTLCEITPRTPYITQIQGLLAELHNLGYMHGDVGNDNVVIDETRTVCKLIDFGESHTLEEAKEKLKQGLKYYESGDQTLEDAMAAELRAVTRDWFLD